MSSLSVRKIDEETLARLRVRAARRGVSMEEEVRQILRRAARAPERLGGLATQIFGPSGGVELEMRRAGPHEPISLEG
jgi:antitoxin FitA